MKPLITTLVAVSTASLVATTPPADAAATPYLDGRSVLSTQRSAEPDSAGHDRIVSHPGATSETEQESLTEFWTPARMRRAISLDTQRPGGPTPDAAQPLEGRTTFKGGRWTKGGKVTRTTGKVFFESRRRLYVCSASIVSGVSADIVVTAGHCVHDRGRWATRWVFVPKYRAGRHPFGTWTGRTLYATRQWVNRGAFNYDVGFVRMNRRGGRHIANRVGSQGIIFNRARRKYIRAFGYPAASPYDGEHLIYCRGRARRDRFTPRSTAQGIPCNMTPGASGGPWLIRFKAKAGTGLVNSVSSYHYQGIDRLYGPYFGSVIQRLYASVQPTAKDGSYLRVQENGKIFRVRDGGLVRIKSWRQVGGQKKYFDVTKTYLNRFR